MAATDHRLIAKGRESEADKITKAFRFGIPGYLLATLLTLVAVPAGPAVDGALAVFHSSSSGETLGAEAGPAHGTWSLRSSTPNSRTKMSSFRRYRISLE